MVCVVGVSDSILDFQSKGESLNQLSVSKNNVLLQNTKLCKKYEHLYTKRGEMCIRDRNDGSTINNLQVVVDLANFDEEMLKLITTGACISVNGEMVESVGSGQKVEVQAREIEVLGTCDNTYPLQKKGHSMEFLREIAHLRPRTNTFGAVFRIRHNMAIAIHREIQGNTNPRKQCRARNAGIRTAICTRSLRKHAQ